jgi:hypothetical protein
VAVTVQIARLLWKVPEDHDNSIQLCPLSRGKNSMFNLVAIFGVIGSTTTPRSVSENCGSLQHQGVRIIFGKTNA